MQSFSGSFMGCGTKCFAKTQKRDIFEEAGDIVDE